MRVWCLCLGLILPAVFSNTALADKLFGGTRVEDAVPAVPNKVRHRCLTPEGNDRKLASIQRTRAWSLPRQALAVDFDTTIHCLVLRYDFQFEQVDDPNTTGRGIMDLSRPLDTLTDSAYIQRVGHLVDPPPHDSLYFDAHMRALNRYWEQVSEGRVHLTWDVFPPWPDSVYQLPEPMSFYGRCNFDEVVEGLEQFFIDCIQLADTAHLLNANHPDINFSQYEAFFIFHAGSDGQNDIGFPPTCADLFSGFIRFGEGVVVDNGAFSVTSGLMMPETAVQDNRATALNAVMAHEFGHHLGLVDLYNTQNFFSQLGDFALMDNNGFGTGIDFGWPSGRVFGAIPLYPMAWSRAYLGFAEVADFRADTNDIRLVAAEIFQDTGLKVARVPITENEYYLLENRITEVDGKTTFVLADSATSVIQGPVTLDRQFTGEYDFLMPGDPGGGMLIFLVDEAVALLDYDGDSVSNFYDNDLQWWVEGEERKFITLIEGDGLVHFGGYYRAGFGSESDMYRDDRNSNLTPNTNPPAIDNSGNNTHIYVTGIRRDTVGGTSVTTYNDRVMFFDLEYDRKVDGFPVRAGEPALGLAPIADDLDGDGSPEVIVVSDQWLVVATSDGEDFIRGISTCDTCPLFVDSVLTSINRGTSYNPPSVYTVPVYVEAPATISAGPVTGKFSPSASEKLVAIGYATDSASGRVITYAPSDFNNDAQADFGNAFMPTSGTPIALSFGDRLYALTDSGLVYRKDGSGTEADYIDSVRSELYHGICRIGDHLVVLAGDSAATNIYFVADTVHSFALAGFYKFGPITVDMNRDGQPEIVAFTADGDGVYVTVDTTNITPTFTLLAERATGHAVTTNPIAGDVDLDGYPDIVIGGVNSLYAYNAALISKTDFPLEVDDRYPVATVIAAPVMAGIERGGVPELVFPTGTGNFYSFGPERSYGFPLSSGEQQTGLSGTPAVIFHDESGGKLGYLGGDGWFYAWEVDADTTADFWVMGGADPHGSFALAPTNLSDPVEFADSFPEEKYYNYPNPVRNGSTQIRYFLGKPAGSVKLDIYDLSGHRVASFEGTTEGGTDHEITWSCTGVTPGVYRCVIEVEFVGETINAFTDIAVLR